jgi:quinol monooxygenase YgiN
MICTSGVWIVKEGRQEEFQRRWQESVDSAVMDYPEVKFRLLRDHLNRARFVSFGEGWRTFEQVETMRETPAFQESMSAIWRLLESGELSTLELVAEVS